MSKINNVLKENYELKEEFRNMISLVHNNEVISEGFKIIGFSLLLSDNLAEISDTALKYLEQIFNLDRAVIFLKEGSYEILASIDNINLDRVKTSSDKSFQYTFLEKRVYNGRASTSIHSDFYYMDNQHYSYILAPITDNGNIVGVIGLYSLDEERFALEENFDFINDLALFTAIAIKNLNNRYLLGGK